MKKLTNFYLLSGFAFLLLCPGGSEPAQAQGETPELPKSPTKEEITKEVRVLDSLRSVERVLDREIEIKLYKDSIRIAIDSLKTK